MKLCEQSREFISSCVTEQNAYSVLSSLCKEAGPRPSGSDAEGRATEMVMDLFSQYGLQTQISEFTYPGWERGDTEAIYCGEGKNRRVPCYPLGWCPQGTTRAPVGDAGFGSEADFRERDLKGKIALVRSGAAPNTPNIHRSAKYELAEKAGAAGFAFFAEHPGGLVLMGSARLEPRMGTIPGIGLCYEDAVAILAAGHSAEMEIISNCRPIETVSRNGIGIKPGTLPQEIVVCGHIDSWFNPGAVDNGSGIAMLVELARLLEPYDLRRSVRFITFGSEELGLLGSKSYIETNPDVSGITAVMNLDCTAVRDGHLTITTNENPRLHRFFEELGTQLHLGLELHGERTRHSDHDSFREKGVACAAFLSHSPSYGFGHTAYDTLDKLNPESFTIPLVIAGVSIIECTMREELSFSGPFENRA